MKFNRLILENIGAYRDENIFDLTTSGERNVILIGGENGAGKTTFLNSIKLGLFGAYGLGVRNSSEYDDRVFASLNAIERTKEKGHAKIQIEFSEVENMKKNNYSLIRRWKISNKKFKETLEIYKNKVLLDPSETDNYFSKLKELFPPKLFDLCLFDGEEIARIITNNELSLYLNELSTIVFNLDLFNNLQSDLTIYLQKEIDAKKFTQTESELFAEQANRTNLLNDLNTALAAQKELLEKKEFKHEEYLDKKKSFEIHGGLQDEKRSNLLKKEAQLEIERKNLMEQVKGFISLYLPFYMNKDLLSDAFNQIKLEDQLLFFNQAQTILTEEEVKDILNTLNKHDISSIDLHGLILNKLKPTHEVETIHNLSPSQRGQIEMMNTLVNKESHDCYLDMINENRELLTQTSNIRRKIAINDKTSDFKSLLDEMALIQQEIGQLELDLTTLDESISELEKQLMVVEKSIATKESYLKQENRTVNTFEMAQNIIKLSDDFQQLQQKKKLQQVQIVATDMLNKLMRKKDYVSAIRIDSKTFDVILYNTVGEKIEKTTLSAGEKEILLLSIIWAMFKCSGRRVPFIFDTLLGRLDVIHKQKVLTEYIPKCGEQVLILATNSEVNSTQLDLLQPHISKQYILNFDIDQESIDVKTGYFNFN